MPERLTVETALAPDESDDCVAKLGIAGLGVLGGQCGDDDMEKGHAAIRGEQQWPATHATGEEGTEASRDEIKDGQAAIDSELLEGTGDAGLVEDLGVVIRYDRLARPRDDDAKAERDEHAPSVAGRGKTLPPGLGHAALCLFRLELQFDLEYLGRDELVGRVAVGVPLV